MALRTHIRRRLETLEERIQPGKCPSCGGRPTRTVFIDPRTDTAWQESMPFSGCPSCGQEPISELHIMIGEDGCTDYV